MTAKASSESSPYVLDPSSIKVKNGKLEGTIIKTIGNDQKVNLPLVATFLETGNARFTIDEELRQKGQIELRHNSIARKERYNEAGEWALTGAGLQAQKDTKVERQNDRTEVTWGTGDAFKAVITHAPFGVEFFTGGEKRIVLNNRGFMNVEHWRPKIEKPVPAEGEEKPEVTQPEEDESTWWEETFGGNTDSKPRGPESVAMDITFPGFSHVYGLAEHTGPLSLKETRGREGNHDQPYRMYNADVFEFELDSPMTLYGSIPFMTAHNKDTTVGVFWLNAAETWVDIVKTKHTANILSLGLKSGADTHTHWMSESGLIDIFILLGPKPQDMNKKYAELTGYSQLPPMFSIAYHQCRWNYMSDEEVREVDQKFDKFNIPLDVIWLDLEYTDDRKYFTWNPDTFKDPIGMLKQLAETERQLVVLIDPHIKNTGNYPVVDEMKTKDLAVKNKDNDLYEGWCWPGSSHWIDAFNPAARAWWKSWFTYDRFKGTLPNVWIWNDMAEPSVFNGPDVSMPRDNIHHGNWEHRDVHNINGMTFHNATYHALISRAKGESRRPFILTRAFYAGSQRLGAMWTGDNQASWEHLHASIPMVLNQGVSGYPWAGADVGGFFGNPGKELLARWYQAGAFYPFFRAHAHLDARRREPYLLGTPYTEVVTQAIRLRYSLLPAWYTAFHEAHTAGLPIVRAQYYVHPGDEAGFAMDDQFYLGDTGLLVKPVTYEGQTKVDIYIADDETYYDYFDYTVYSGSAGRSHSIVTPLEKIPLLMQGGHIVPRKDRPRKSSGLMKWDPYTLVVILDKAGNARGELYIDDGETFENEQGAFIHRQFTIANNVLRSADLAVSTGPRTAAYHKTMQGVTVERIIVVNAPAEWAGLTQVEVTAEGTGKKSSSTTTKVDLTYHAAENGKAAWAVVRNPAVPIGSTWSINFQGSGRDKTEL